MNRCFLCRSKDVEGAPFSTDPPYAQWLVCRACGSQTALREYDASLYPDGFSAADASAHGGIAACRESCRNNAEMFERFAAGLPDRTFLDVGCGDGAMLDLMAAAGWSVHGWDVTRPHYHGPHVTVSPLFNRWLFPRRFAAVNAREVIEHCPWPDLLLHEMHGACLPGGLVQVQTPEPVDRFDPGVHSVGHLFVASEGAIKEMLGRAHLEVLEEMHWGVDGDRQRGQAYLCRARG